MNDYVREVSQSAKIGHAAIMRRLEMDRVFESHVMRVKNKLGITEPFMYPQVLEHHLAGDPIVSSWQYVFAPAVWGDGPLLLGVVSKRGASDLLLTLVDRSDDEPHIVEYAFQLEPHLEMLAQKAAERAANSRGEN